MAAAIVTKGLTKKYGDRVVVDHLDLKINEGEVFGLLGPNGAGKTTTILMCLGLSEPTSGTATVVGFDPTRQPIEVKQVVGYLPDAVGFYEGMTGRENLRYTARLNGLEKDEGENRIESLLTEVGLADAADRPGRHLLAGYEAAARDRRRAGQGSQDSDPRRADGLHRPRRRRRDPGADQEAGRRAGGDPAALQPPPPPGPVGLRPGGDLRRGSSGGPGPRG